jgi:hypothetical protein
MPVSRLMRSSRSASWAAGWVPRWPSFMAVVERVEREVVVEVGVPLREGLVVYRVEEGNGGNLRHVRCRRPRCGCGG